LVIMTVSKAKAAELAKVPASKPVTNGVNALLRSLTLDEAGEARAAIARQLARRMDTPGTGATSLALLSRELRSLLADLIDPDRAGAAADLIKSIFSDDS
jgi:hypothetical protein